jgi:hypothetical protein
MFQLHYNYASALAREQKQNPRSPNQLNRYKHEILADNSFHRDIPPAAFLFIFLFLIVIIVSQILIVHYSRSNSNYVSNQKIQGEMKQMDDTMNTIIRDSDLPYDKWRLVLDIQNSAEHFQYLIDLFNKSNDTVNSSDNQQRNREYCNEEPSHLRKFNSMEIIVNDFSFCRRPSSST